MSHVQPSQTPPPEETNGTHPSDKQQQQQDADPEAPPEHKAVIYYPSTGAEEQRSQPLKADRDDKGFSLENFDFSFVPHIIFSICITIFCACPCGLTACILAGK